MKIAQQLHAFAEKTAEEIESIVLELNMSRLASQEGFDRRIDAVEELFRTICNYTKDMTIAIRVDAERDRNMIDAQIKKAEETLERLRKAVLSGELPTSPGDEEAVRLATAGEANYEPKRIAVVDSSKETTG